MHAFPRTSSDTQHQTVQTISCAYLKHGMLWRGKLAITQEIMEFKAKGGWNGKGILVSIPFAEILNIEKKNTAYIVPDAIQISTTEEKHYFASFMHRETTYKSLIHMCLGTTMRPHFSKDLACSQSASSLYIQTEVNSEASSIHTLSEDIFKSIRGKRFRAISSPVFATQSDKLGIDSIFDKQDLEPPKQDDALTSHDELSEFTPDLATRPSTATGPDGSVNNPLRNHSATNPSSTAIIRRTHIIRRGLNKSTSYFSLPSRQFLLQLTKRNFPYILLMLLMLITIVNVTSTFPPELGKEADIPMSGDKHAARIGRRITEEVHNSMEEVFHNLLKGGIQ